ncbi:MAG TPA: PEGA domain-containing protein [Burkholderiales bacterium]
MKVRLDAPRGTEEGDLGAGTVQITAPGAAGMRAGAALALAGDAPFLQPLDGAAAVFLNDHRLAASQWLRDGDRVRLGEAILEVRINDGGLVLRTDAEVALAGGTPPAQVLPPPAAPVLRRTRVGGAYVLLALAALAGVLWFVFSARMLYVQVDPVPDRLSLDGKLPALRLREGYLALPGTYRLVVERDGYQRLAREVEITGAAHQRLSLVLVRLPGYLSVEAAGIAGATVLVNGEIKGRTPLPGIELAAGDHEILVRAEGYAEFSRTVRIEGLGRRQSIVAALIPASAAVTVQSKTAGATLWLAGEEVGALPLTLELAAGTHVLEVRAPGYKPSTHSVSVTAGRPQTVGPMALSPADATLRIESEPAGASVSVNGRYVGTTPTTLALAPGRDHRVTLSKLGYGAATRSVRLERAEERNLRLTLSAELGPVTLDVEPRDAVLTIEGRVVGPANGRHMLPAAPTLLEIAREGLEPARIWVTPKPGFEQTRALKLRVAGAPAQAPLPERITAPDGTVMILVRPGRFTMGASRRDPGQRANETLRDTNLVRPFYLGATEVTNAQFRKHRPKHQSGRFGALALDVPSHPVVNVRWEDAAAYCNWLNEAAQLPASYAGGRGGLTAVLPLQHGYRLPTEAEWEWAARRAGVEKETRFPWGDVLPPPRGSGNFADHSVSGELADTIRNYDDGYAGTAPGGRFKASPAGFLDLAGNAAEWTHDFYEIRVVTKPETDPTGPAAGKQHVIRGSSWMQASISALRSTYRDYGTDPRPDVGFRCARYATENP